MIHPALQSRPAPAQALFTLSEDPGCALAEAMSAEGTALRADRNHEIYAEQDKASHLYRVVSGVVRTCRFLVDGRRQIGAFYFPGDVFGFASGATHGFSAEAVGPCRLVAVRRAALAERAACDPAVAAALWRAAGQELGRTQEHMVLLGRMSAAERITGFLEGLADRAPGEHLDIPMSRQDIADYLGLTIETVSRTITHLEETGAIALESARRLRLRPALLAA